MARGKFIVIEGPDGSGKSTLATGLARKLEESGCSVVQAREPGGTPAAEAARAVVLDPNLEVSEIAELYLYLAARADHVARGINPALSAGKYVVCDRFELSTFAYQVAGRGLPRDAVYAANALATGGLRPDLTVIIDLSPEASRARLESAGKQLDRLDEAGEGLHRLVDEAFRSEVGDSIVHLDGTPDPSVVLEQAWEHVSRLIG
jgi:dTMP kinase